jgi:hypothetical protein
MNYEIIRVKLLLSFLNALKKECCIFVGQHFLPMRKINLNLNVFEILYLVLQLKLMRIIILSLKALKVLSLNLLIT